MKIELKHLKVNLQFSEETTMFQANLFIDGMFAGPVYNDGHGGSTCIQPNDPKGRDLINQANAYCKTMPNTEEYDLPMDLELFIDLEVDKYINAKEKSRFSKRMEKDMLKGLVVGVKDSGSYRLFKTNIPISLIPAPQLGKIISGLKLKLNPGESILNTNLPKDLI